MHGGGNEEDALDGVGGERPASGGVDGLHCEVYEGSDVAGWWVIILKTSRYLRGFVSLW